MNDERVRSISAPLPAIFATPALGLSFAFALARVPATKLHEVETFDPVTFGFNAATRWAIAAVARPVPAAWVTRLDLATGQRENIHR